MAYSRTRVLRVFSLIVVSALVIRLTVWPLLSPSSVSGLDLEEDHERDMAVKVYEGPVYVDTDTDTCHVDMPEDPVHVLKSHPKCDDWTGAGALHSPDEIPGDGECSANISVYTSPSGCFNIKHPKKSLEDQLEEIWPRKSFRPTRSVTSKALDLKSVLEYDGTSAGGSEGDVATAWRALCILYGGEMSDKCNEQDLDADMDVDDAKHQLNSLGIVLNPVSLALREGNREGEGKGKEDIVPLWLRACCRTDPLNKVLKDIKRLYGIKESMLFVTIDGTMFSVLGSIVEILSEGGEGEGVPVRIFWHVVTQEIASLRPKCMSDGGGGGSDMCTRTVTLNSHYLFGSRLMLDIFQYSYAVTIEDDVLTTLDLLQFHKAYRGLVVSGVALTVGPYTSGDLVKCVGVDVCSEKHHQRAILVHNFPGWGSSISTRLFIETILQLPFEEIYDGSITKATMARKRPPVIIPCQNRIGLYSNQGVNGAAVGLNDPTKLPGYEEVFDGDTAELTLGNQWYITHWVDADEEDELQELYKWIDEVPLSRPKRNLARDFSDGVMCAETVAHFIPKLVDIHNYPSTMSSNQKKYNWQTLNQKVFRRLGFQVNQQQIDNITTNVAGAVEPVLTQLRHCIDDYIDSRRERAEEKRVMEEEEMMAGEYEGEYDDPYGVPQQQWGGEPAHARRGRGRGRGGGGRRVSSGLERQFEEMPMPSQPAKTRGAGGHVGSGGRPVNRGKGVGIGMSVGAGAGAGSPRVKAKLRPGGALEPGLTYADFEEQERTIAEFRQLVETLRTRLRKAEDLIALKDKKIEALERRMGGGMGMGRGRGRG